MYDHGLPSTATIRRRLHDITCTETRHIHLVVDSGGQGRLAVPPAVDRCINHDFVRCATGKLTCESRYGTK
jgi:hypothetical protein